MKIFKPISTYTDFLPNRSAPSLKAYILPNDRPAKKSAKLVALSNRDLRAAADGPSASRGLQRTAEALIVFREASQTAHVACKVLTYAAGLVGAVPGAAVGIALSPLGVLVGIITRGPEKSRLQAAARGAAVTIGIFAGVSAVPSYALACVLTWTGLRAVTKLGALPLLAAVKNTGLDKYLADLDDARSCNKTE